MTIDGEYKNITLFEFLGKWGTQGITIIHFTELPEVGKMMVAYKDENFMNPYLVEVWKITEDNKVFINLL